MTPETPTRPAHDEGGLRPHPRWLAQWLAEHEPSRVRDYPLATCECGWAEAFDQSGADWADHVAAVLAREWLATSTAVDECPDETCGWCRNQSVPTPTPTHRPARATTPQEGHQ